MAVRTEPQLLERERELDEIQATLDEVRRGAGRLVVIEGAPGIGKTRLLQAARESASRTGMEVLQARGGELERGFPFGLVRQLFEPALANASDHDREALLSGAAGTVRPLLAQGQALPLPAIGDALFPVLHGLYWLSFALAERQPLLLAVDDVHWGDLASMRFFAFLAHRLDGLAMLLALAARTTDADATIDLMAELASEPRARVLRPAPLSSHATGELVRSALGPEADNEFCRACHLASGGNPFVLRDLLGELGSEGISPTAAEAAKVSGLSPKTVSRAVLLRLARASDEARRLARAVAVLGDQAELQEAAALAEVDRASAAAAADELVRIDILASGRPLGFVHPITRAAIYNDLPIGERSAAHAFAARLLAERDADSDRVAIHLLATDPAGDPGSVEMLRVAARRALEHGNADAAVLYLKRAWNEPPRAEDSQRVLREMLTTLLRAGDIAALGELRETLLKTLTAGSETLLESAQELAFALYAIERDEEASQVLARAVKVAAAAGDHDLALRMEVQRMQSDQTVPAEIQARMERYRTRIAPSTPAERVWLALEAYRRMLISENASDAADLARRALGGWLLFVELALGSPLAGQMIVVLLEAEDFDFAERAIEFMMTGAQATGTAAFLAAATGFRSELAYRRGDIADAVVDARTAIEIARSHGFLHALPLYVYWMVDALVERGELEAAERELERVGMTKEVPDRFWYSPILHSRADLRLAQGRPREALADLLEMSARCERDGIVPWRSDAHLVARMLGEDDQARRLAEVHLKQARRWGAPGRVGHALRTTGLVEGGDEGLERLEEAIALLRQSQVGLEHMRALADYGAALRRANRRAEAREPLREALDLARRRGALAIARRAHEELEATGEKLRPLLATGIDSLTPSEGRIARMAAEGMTNRDIAQALFLTVKTVETHLSHTYRKLDIRSRAELPRALQSG